MSSFSEWLSIARSAYIRLSLGARLRAKHEMSPYQHDEVYVLDDGAETDLDLGRHRHLLEALHHDLVQLRGHP